MWTFQGTHTDWGHAGLPPTGARQEMRGMTIMRVVDGRILEEWTEFDEGGAYLQILGQ
jgi:predicted ester cyclase